MILDTEEDKENGADWVDFASAWRDERLAGYALRDFYGKVVGSLLA
ncbi:MAG: hypothetical protein Ct9H300mP30_4120 [Methanobacteriota archaeon]|nr:MAG: hypothetical protein Ct9H300mP30_4120 [Euryarchaeota archaeon]